MIKTTEKKLLFTEDEVKAMTQSMVRVARHLNDLDVFAGLDYDEKYEICTAVMEDIEHTFDEFDEYDDDDEDDDFENGDDDDDFEDNDDDEDDDDDFEDEVNLYDDVDDINLEDGDDE